MTEKETVAVIKQFLGLPGEALPSAVYLEEGEEYAGSAWAQLLDYAGPKKKRSQDHLGERVLLNADRPEWRDGVVVVLN